MHETDWREEGKLNGSAQIHTELLQPHSHSLRHNDGVECSAIQSAQEENKDTAPSEISLLCLARTCMQHAG